MKALTFLLAAALLPIVGAGQSQPSQAPAGRAPDISVTVDRVPVNVTVSDNKGKFVTNLQRQDFRVYEDDRIQTIIDFDAETDLPLTVALLVDTSGSVRDKLRFEQEAAIEFFYSNLKRGKDKALVISFDTGVDLLTADSGGPGVDFTDDPEKLANAVRKIRAGGGTSMYDAVYLAAKERLAKEPGRKLIILISDGDDNSSRVSLTEALETAQKSDVAIYAISTNKTADFGSAEQERGDKTLRKMAEETGGRVFFPLKLSELAANFQNIGEELRAQYTLYYSPTNQRADGTFRRIRIDLPNKDLKARARTGYYAPRATAASRN